MTRVVVRTVGLAVLPNGDALHSDMATFVNIADEGAGEYVEVRQTAHGSVFRIDLEEWPVLRGAIDKMIAGCGGAT